MLAPLRQGGGDFAFVTVLVVDSYKAALAMIDAQLGNMRRDAERAQSGAEGAAQVMVGPIRQAAAPIESLLRMRPVAKATIAIAEKVIRPVALCRR